MGSIHDLSRVGRLFPALLAPSPTALIRGFLNSFAMRAHAGPYGSYDKLKKRKDSGASNAVARHVNNHSHHMTICSLSLHHGNTENREKLFFN